MSTDGESDRLIARERELRERIDTITKRLAKLEGRAASTSKEAEVRRELPRLAPERAAEALFDVLHAELGLVGQLKTTGGDVDWQSLDAAQGTTLLQVRLENEGPRTSMTLSAPAGLAAMARVAPGDLLGSAGVIMLAMGAVGMWLPPEKSWLVFIALVLGSGLGMVGFIRWLQRRGRARLEMLADRIAPRIAQASVPRTRVAEPSAESADDVAAAEEADVREARRA